jgi:hypothetical protein
MPLSIIWLVTSFGIKVLVLHFRLIILLRSRAKARFRGYGARGGEGGRDVVLEDEEFRQTDALADDLLPARIVACS